MRILRGQPIANVTAVFVLVLATASSLVIVSPRSTSAEGFLLGTVRCLVRSLLTGECVKAQTPAPQPQPQPQPAPEPSQQTPPPKEASLEAPSAGGSPGVRSTPTPAYTPLELPLEPVGKEVAVPVEGAVKRDSIPESEYVAYFNTHSPYAVKGAQQTSVATVPIERSSEGWRLFGVAWYVWALFIVLVTGVFASVKYVFLRRKSVLSKGG